MDASALSSRNFCAPCPAPTRLRQRCSFCGQGCRLIQQSRPLKAPLINNATTGPHGGAVCASAAAGPAGGSVCAVDIAAPAPAPAPPPAQLPATFRRLVARRTGSSFREVAEVQEGVPLPTPQEGEALVRVHYAGINGGCETFRARGEYAFAGNKQAPEFALGAEGTGVVAAVGPGASSLAVGQAVTFVGGAFAEYVVAKAALCWPVPAPSPEAVACAISGVVANAALKGVAGMAAGERVLVTAAAGGTGHFAAQLARLAGCHVVATCGGGRKAARLRAAGIHRVIDYHTEDVAAVLAAEYPGGFDVIYEGVGGAMQRTAYANLAQGGRMLVVGYISEYPHTSAGSAEAAASAAATAAASTSTSTSTTSGAASSGVSDSTPSSAASSSSGGSGSGSAPSDAPLPPSAELFWGGMTVHRGSRTVYGSVWPKDRAHLLRCKAEVFELQQQGKLQAWIDDSAAFEGLESIPDAIDHMLSGTTIGKVVVKLA